MTAEKDPRIEAVAKLLFTGPLFRNDAEGWDDPRSWIDRRMFMDAAEDVLRGIDEAEDEREYRIQRGGTIRYTRARSEAVRAHQAGHHVRVRIPPFERPGSTWQPLP